MIQLIRNINLIFWGTLIVIIDFSFSSTTNGTGIKFDVINDFIGSIMIFIGLSKISKIELMDTSFQSNMNFSVIASGIHILYSISDFFIYPIPDFINTLKNLLDLVVGWGLVTFAGAKIILTTQSSLDKSLKKWIMTRNLLLWIYFLPLAVLTVISEITSFVKQYRFNWAIEFGLGGKIGFILLVIILLIPIIYWLFTMHMMKMEIKQKY